MSLPVKHYGYVRSDLIRANDTENYLHADAQYPYCSQGCPYHLLVALAADLFLGDASVALADYYPLSGACSVAKNIHMNHVLDLAVQDFEFLAY